MCHRVRVLLSAEEKEDVKKLTGIMVPVYATIMLVLVAVVAVATQQEELIASSVTPITTR